MKKGYYITSDGITHPIKPSYSLSLYNRNIIKLVVPDDVKIVWCGNNNKLSELNLPNGIEFVSCYNNNLSELNLPNSITDVLCQNNNLSELILPNGVKEVYCDNINIPNLYKFINNDNVEIYINL